MVLQSLVNVIFIVENMGYMGLFILMTLESLSLPIPSEVILPFTGYLIYIGRLSLIPALIDSVIASLIGSLILYLLSYYVGYSIVLKLGKYVGISRRHLDAAEQWFNKYGGVSVVLAKFIPGIRALISIPAGVARMNVWLFMLYTTVGSTIWNIVLIYIGLSLGPAWETGLTLVSRYIDYLALALIAVVIVLVIAARKHWVKYA
ncbi:DedA family protein [Caldivirga maquilingensis]|uniref:SNARE associated Golgi protein n=1 Tax=Caldivirga maquilingensis (strain ATCC 700844 / DSM 13496 / JCM 10307 / IC-167) TaxID=397948 RepID=A8MAD9_CALMQ|nr:DedA family protein [Caldivirga maquilingensis]ABW02516.1 SNARE associated Golgi protein [Caldivirga maquilingensis IC-167]